jgi:hypothetical protein
MITHREKALLHIYPKLAGLTEPERRRIMLGTADVYSCKQALTQRAFEDLMAAFETELWERVQSGQVMDPRLCTICNTPLARVHGGYGECPDGCEVRKVYAWQPDYWRKRLIPSQGISTRQVFKIKQLWALLVDYIPADQNSHHYLAGLAARMSHRQAHEYLAADGTFTWEALTAADGHKLIEALKDRLLHAIPDK